MSPSSGGYGAEAPRFITNGWPDYTRPQSLNGWAYSENDPINRTDPSGHFSCSFATLSVQKHILEDLGWGSCQQGIEHVLDVLDQDRGQASSIVVWAFREADANEGMAIRFIDPPGGANPHGWRDNFSATHTGHVEIDGNGLPQDLLANQESMQAKTLAYISILAHEFWHATMQVAGTANLTNMEAEAFGVQAQVLKELNGDQAAIDYLKSVSNDPAQFNPGYSNTPFKYATACVAYLRVLGPFWGDYAAFNRRNEVLQKYGK